MLVVQQEFFRRKFLCLSEGSSRMIMLTNIMNNYQLFQYNIKQASDENKEKYKLWNYNTVVDPIPNS